MAAVYELPGNKSGLEEAGVSEPVVEVSAGGLKFKVQGSKFKVGTADWGLMADLQDVRCM